MCKKCNDKKCGGCSSGNAGGGDALSQLQSQVDDLMNDVKFLLCGHPILMIQNLKDVQSFDLTTGKGSDCWEGWAICDGKTHKNPTTKENIVTPNLIDRFVVMATGTYAVDAIGGVASVSLSANQNGLHTHTVNDPGHTHTVNDPGHSHGTNDIGHTHTGNTAPHTHSFTTDVNGDHNHAIPELVDLVSDGGTGAHGANDPITLGNSGVNGAHSHTGTTDEAAAVLDVEIAPTGVTIQEAFTGITNDSAEAGVSINNSGLGDAHENRPPYYALIFVMKI